MAFTFEINGEDRTAYFVRQSIRISEQLQANGQSMSIVLEIKDQAIVKPLGGQHVKFMRDAVIEFAGRISSINEYHELQQNVLRFELNCVDYTVDLDNKLLNEDIEGNTAGEVISAIIGRVGRGFTSVNTEEGAVVTGIEPRLEYPSAIISRIAESMEHQWYVDYNRDLNFFYVLNRPAPISEIQLDTDTGTYADAAIEERWEQVKNVIYLTGAKVKAGGGGGGGGGPDLSDSIRTWGDGETRFFPLNYEPWDLESTSVTVDGIPQEILLDTNAGQAGDGLGEAGQCYLCIDNWGVRFPDDHPPAAQNDHDLPINVEIGYGYAYEPIIKVEDPVSIAAMMERENYVDAPSDGVHEFKFEIPSLRVTDEATIWDYGNLLLQRYSMPFHIMTFSSRIQGWHAGQSLRVFSASANRAFDETCYVQAVYKSILKSSDDQALFLYQIELSTSPFPA